jgi:hypothetical protein
LGIIKHLGLSESFCGRFLTFVQYPPKITVFDLESKLITFEASFNTAFSSNPIVTSDHLIGVERSRGWKQFVCSFAKTEATTTL